MTKQRIKSEAERLGFRPGVTVQLGEHEARKIIDLKFDDELPHEERLSMAEGYILLWAIVEDGEDPDAYQIYSNKAGWNTYLKVVPS